VDLVEKINEVSLSALNNPFCEILVRNGWSQIHRFVKGHPTKGESFGVPTLQTSPITNYETGVIVEQFIDSMFELTAPERELRTAQKLRTTAAGVN